jgi:hypothetical protein
MIESHECVELFGTQKRLMNADRLAGPRTNVAGSGPLHLSTGSGFVNVGVNAPPYR